MTIEAINVSSVDLNRLVWRKSSRSGQNGSNGACVEVAFADVEFRKSSRSGQDGSNGNCVEVGFSGPAVVIRDSKSPDRGNLVLPSSGWAGFLRVSKT
jgi:uncharacterized protein DUF397